MGRQTYIDRDMDSDTILSQLAEMHCGKSVSVLSANGKAAWKMVQVPENS